MSGITKSGLRRFNLIVAGLDLLQGSLLIALSNDAPATVTGHYMGYSPVAKTFLPASQVLFQFRIVWLLAAIFLISAVVHFLVATILRPQYEAYLNRGLNPIRWIEYGLVGSLITLVMALLSGIFDIESLYMIFDLTAIMCLLAWVMERVNEGRGKTSWMVYAIGVGAGLLPWLIIGHSLRLNAEFNGGPPAYVYFLFFTTFVMFTALAVNMVLYYRRYDGWKDYLYSEKSYIWLGLAAKTLFAWQVYFGLLHS